MPENYHSYKQFLIDRFGEPVLKLPIDAGFSCPNRDGTVGTGGCSYCLNQAFVPRYCDASKSITQQIEDGITFHRNRGRESRIYLAYFQAFSNTHAPIEQLKEIYEEALAHPKVKGLVVGTRPDCVNEEKLDYFASLQGRCFVSIEYGIESCYDRTLLRIHRGHDFSTALHAVHKTAERGLHTGAHFIIGLPGETQDDWRAQVATINKMPINSIKFHQLQILKGTAMEKDFQEHPEDFHRFDMDEYVDLMVYFVKTLRPDIVIERFASEVPPKYLSTCFWGMQRYDVILQKIREKLKGI